MRSLWEFSKVPVSSNKSPMHVELSTRIWDPSTLCRKHYVCFLLRENVCWLALWSERSGQYVSGPFIASKRGNCDPTVDTRLAFLKRADMIWRKLLQTFICSIQNANFSVENTTGRIHIERFHFFLKLQKYTTFRHNTHFLKFINKKRVETLWIIMVFNEISALWVYKKRALGSARLLDVGPGSGPRIQIQEARCR